MFTVLIIISANVFIAYRWIKNNPNWYIGHLKGRKCA